MLNLTRPRPVPDLLWPRLALLLCCLAGSFLVLAWSPSALAAPPGGLPPTRAISEIQRIDFLRSDTSYRALFPDRPEDAVKAERLVELYNRATANLGPPGPVPDAGGLWFLSRVRLTFQHGQSVTMVLHQGVRFYTTQPAESRLLTDAALTQELEELALGLFVPARGVQVTSRELQVGDAVTVSSDALRGDEAHILLMPAYWPVTIPSAPAPYPVPEAILLATVPVQHDRFTYTFTLTEEIGQRLDGSPGRIGPGAWDLVVSSGGLTQVPVTILPGGAPEPLAVVYDRGRVLTWRPAHRVTTATLADPAEQPLLISESPWGTPITHVSPGFLNEWLDIPVTAVTPDTFRLGNPDLGLIVTTGDDSARTSGTMLQLGGTLRRFGGAWRLPWGTLAGFFGYRIQWLGSEQVAFLRGLDAIPQDLQEALAAVTFKPTEGMPVTLVLDGQEVGLGDQQAFLDPDRGRVMVPLRATVAALGGRVDWFALDPGMNLAAAQHNKGLPPWADQVSAYFDANRDTHLWRVYLGPGGKGPVMVTLRELALALGYRLTWDGVAGRVFAETANEK